MKFTFKEDGTPDFGTPAGPATVQANPSGDPGMGELYEAEDWQLAGGAVKAAANKNFSGTGYVDGFTKKGAKATFTAEAAGAGVYRVIVRYANGVDVVKLAREGPQTSSVVLKSVPKGFHDALSSMGPASGE
jgi:hypothetical protein